MAAVTPQNIADAYTAAGIDSTTINATVLGSVGLVTALTAANLTGAALTKFLTQAGLLVAIQTTTQAIATAQASQATANAGTQSTIQGLQSQITGYQSQLAATISS